MHDLRQGISIRPLTQCPALTITRPTSGEAANRLMTRVLNRHGTALRTRPVCCVIGDAQTTIWASADALPFRNASIRDIQLANVLEHIRDDEQLVAELSRILAPGGTLRLRVPNAGPLAGFDSFNLFHYLVDVTHRGERPHEIDEIGWRRHYSLNDLALLLGPDRFTIAHAESSGIGASELANVAAMGLFRWLTEDEARYRQSRRITAAIARAGSRIPTASSGFWLEIVAIRLPSSSE
jgi:SAM-dependent methyltransferase